MRIVVTKGNAEDGGDLPGCWRGVMLAMFVMKEKPEYYRDLIKRITLGKLLSTFPFPPMSGKLSEAPHYWIQLFLDHKKKKKESWKELNHFKVIVLGDSESGKTTLVRSLCSSKLSPRIQPKNGIEISELIVRHPSDGDLKFYFWDFSKLQDHSFTHRVLVTKNALIMYVWSMTHTFAKHEFWLESLKHNFPDCKIVVVGTRLGKTHSFFL
jgi:hypothetical protein